MTRLLDVNLIYFLDFYFALMFVLGTVRRATQYSEIGRLAFTGPGRWPKLLDLIRSQRAVFLTVATVTPLALALGLSLVQLVASRLVWPDAGEPPHGLTVGVLLEHWLAALVVVPLGAAMIGLDVYFLVRVAEIDRASLEKHFDQAEYWLASKASHVVKAVTFGFVDPRRKVADEVRKALMAASDLLNASLWWWNAQIALRFAFGASLWLTWAMS